MRILKNFILFAVLFVCQTAVFSRINIFGGHLDVLLSTVIVWGLLLGADSGFAAGAVTGYFVDIFSSASHMVYLPTLALTGFVSGIVRGKVFRERAGVIALSVFLISMFSYFFSGYVLFLFYGKEIQNFWLPMIVSSALNAFFAPIAAKASEKIGNHE